MWLFARSHCGLFFACLHMTCGGGLARDGIDAFIQKHGGACIASKPAPTQAVLYQRLSSDAVPATPNNPALMRLNQLWPLPLRR